MEFTRYEVTLRVDKSDGSHDHSWTMTWNAESFGHAELLTKLQLNRNEDNSSYIYKIELF